MRPPGATSRSPLATAFALPLCDTTGAYQFLNVRFAHSSRRSRGSRKRRLGRRRHVRSQRSTCCVSSASGSVMTGVVSALKQSRATADKWCPLEIYHLPLTAAVPRPSCWARRAVVVYTLRAMRLRVHGCERAHNFTRGVDKRVRHSTQGFSNGRAGFSLLGRGSSCRPTLAPNRALGPGDQFAVPQWHEPATAPRGVQSNTALNATGF